MKAILDRKKSAMTVITASHTWAASTAATLANLLRPELAEGETLPDLELLQRLFGRALARRWQRLESADQDHLKATERRGKRTGERAVARVTLYRGVVTLRGLLRDVFGTTAARRLLGIAGETSRDGVVLLHQAEQARARLSDACRALPPAAFEPTAHDRARWTAPVEVAAETLRSADSRESSAVKELEAAVSERRRAIADFNAVFVNVAGWLENTYRAAGRNERAGVVRPSRRRQGQLLTGDVRGVSGQVAPETDKRDTDPAAGGLLPVSDLRQRDASPPR